MRTSMVVFYSLAGWYLLCLVGYVTWCLLALGEIEPAGSVALCCSLAFTALVGFYLQRTRRAAGGEALQDQEGAEIEDGAGEYGEFSPSSWWPIVLAGALALMFLGMAVGSWLSLIGAPLLIVTLVGWVYENYRGHYRH